MDKTALIPCPACSAVRHHPMTEDATESWRDNCAGGGCHFMVVHATVTCAACAHVWAAEIHFSDPDAAALLLSTWKYDGRVFHEFDRDEPADEPYAD